MTETREQIESPSGLDLNPSPPPTARISKKVGLVAIGIVLLVGSMVVYGLYTRKEQQAVKRQAADEKRPEPARIAGDQVVREIAPPAVANAASTPAMPNGVGSSKDGALLSRAHIASSVDRLPRRTGPTQWKGFWEHHGWVCVK